MNRRLRITLISNLVVGTVITLSLPSLADLPAAQPIVADVASVEWWAAHSPLIIRGVIEDVAVHDPGDANNRYQTVTFHVLEAIKGVSVDRLQFVQNGDFGTFALSELRNNRQELLLFLEPWMTSVHFNRSAGG